MTNPTATGPEVWLSRLLHQPVRDPAGRPLGRLADVVVTLPAGSRRPAVRGLVVAVGNRDLFIAADRIADIDGDRIRLTTTTVDLRPFERRAGEVLLRGDILGHRLVDLEHPGLVRAHDAALAETDHGWEVTGVNLHRGGWGRLLRRSPDHALRNWADFEVLIGHQPTAGERGPAGRLRRLKPAHLADLVQTATPDEQRELLSQVRQDPGLEADVFEELDETDQAELLSTRSDTDIADLLARMNPDDAADALLDLPQPRRRPVLDALPPRQRARIIALLGYGANTAGGIMSDDYLAVPLTATVAEALAAVRSASGRQPEALTAVLAVDDDRRLRAVLPLVRAVQADPARSVQDTAESDPVRVPASADAVTITRLMSDHNLLLLPVVDDDERPLGVITVDDALELAIPEDWRRREPTD